MRYVVPLQTAYRIRNRSQSGLRKSRPSWRLSEGPRAPSRDCGAVGSKKRERMGVGMSTWHFTFGGKVRAETAKHWHEARRLAARHFRCAEQDVDMSPFSVEVASGMRAVVYVDALASSAAHWIADGVTEDASAKAQKSSARVAKETP